ncbi:helix-turn-helix domain-containing protein, partial [Xanthomonas oryzae pv. oryzicola]|uniref:helix-turn-helix domain-containing protein n=1 Tax=Xanthomonas oryzae TaxID=347 RepID=UPI003CFB9D74
RLHALHETGMSMRAIADALERAPSTISRELRRNQSPLKNPQTASIARPHLRFWRAGTASFYYSTYWFL